MAEERTPTKEEIAANIKKTEAETRKADIEAAAAKEKSDAESKKAAAETRKLVAEAKEVEFKLVEAKHVADRADEKRRKELAGNEYHHVYLFNNQVTEASVKACIAQLSTWERTLDEGETMTVELQLNSPGGDVVDGFALIDYIVYLQSKGHIVNTVAYGMAASMAGVILEVGDHRSMGSNAVLLIHEASFGAVGSYGEVADRIKLVDIFHERILKLFTDRSNVSKAFIKRNWTRKDWWLSADTALKHGFVDSIQ